MNKEIIYGLLTILIISSSVVYLTFDNSVRLKVTTDDATFYVKDGRWLIGGIEKLRLFDGTKQMYRDAQNVKLEYFFDNGTNLIEVNDSFNPSNHDSGLFIVKRTTPYKRGPIVVSTYIFNISMKDVVEFPTSLKVEVINGSGDFFRYTVDRLTDTGTKRKLVNETKLSFGRHMKVVLNPNYRWAWVGWPYGGDSVSAQYDINSNDETYYFRFYDPTGINLYFNSFANSDVTSEDGSSITVKGIADDSSATVCLSSDISSLGDDFACDTGTVTYDWNASSENNKLSDGSKSKIVTFSAAPEEKLVSLESFHNGSIIKDTSSFKLHGDQTVYDSTSTVYTVDTEDATSCSGSWDSSSTCANTYDGSWTTYGEPQDPATATVYMNYSCSSCSGTRSSTVLEYKADTGAPLTYDETLEDYSCNVDTVQLKFELIESSGGTDYLNIYCKDKDSSSTWNTVKSWSATDSYGIFKLYEAEIKFNDTVYNYYTPSSAMKDTTVDFLNDGSDEFKIPGYLGTSYTYNNKFYSGGTSASSVDLSFSSAQSSKYAYFKTTPDFNAEKAYFKVSGASNGQVSLYNPLTVLFYETDGTSVTRGDTGEIYYFGGQYDANRAMKGTISGNSITWTSVTDVPYNVGVRGCSVYDSDNDKIYVYGGYYSSAYNANIYQYDPSTDTWTSKTSASEGREHASCSYLNGKIYIYGGISSGSAKDTFLIYDISGDSWSTSSSSGDSSYSQCQTPTADDEIFIYGAYMTKPYFYNTTTDSFSSSTTALSHPIYHASCQYMEDGNVYFFGGYNSSGSKYELPIHIYNVSDDSWSVASEELTNYMTYFDSGVVNNKIVAVDPYLNTHDVSLFMTIFPTDVKMSIGNHYIYSGSGVINGSQIQVSDFSSYLTSYVSSCTKESDGSCLVPVKVLNGGVGKITLSNLHDVQTISSINLSQQTIDCGGSSSCNPDISITNDNDGNINISDIKLKFYGTDTITFTAEDKNNSYSTSNTITNYFSNYSYSLPPGASYISFYPFSINTDTYPFGQTDTRPILNITTDNSDGTSYLTFKSVIPTSCISLWYKTTGSYTSVTNDTWTTFATGLSDGDETDLFLKGQYTCSSSYTGYFSPDFYLRACHTGVDICNSEVS